MSSKNNFLNILCDFIAMSSKITKDMTLGEVISKYPQTAEVMMKRGLHCIGCGIAAFETIEQGALAHGMNKKDLNKMVKEINDVISKKKAVKKKPAIKKVKR